MNNVCQNCKKTRATVHLTEIDPDNNQPHEMHLCEDCARESGSAQQDVQTPTISFTTSVVGLPDKLGKGSSTSFAPCPECEMTYQEFRVKGRFGCARCYDAFEKGLLPLLERIHGATQYVGRVPAGQDAITGTTASLTQELVDLRRRMGRLVKSEEYEEAARLRDRIEEVEQILSEGDNG